jgi:hypothetical protein
MRLVQREVYPAQIMEENGIADHFTDHYGDQSEESCLLFLVWHLEFLKPLVLYGKMKVVSRNFNLAFLRSSARLLQHSTPADILEPREECWVRPGR